MPAPVAATVPVVNPSGQLVQIPQGDLQRALDQGYRQPSAEQMALIRRHEEYGGAGQGAISLLEGAGSGLTFGLSSAIEEGLGVDPQAILARRAEHPILHGTGEVLGVAAPLVLSGGASGAGTAARLGAEGVEAARVAGAAGEAAEAARAVGAGGRALEAARAAAPYTAPGLISRAGEAVRAGVEAAKLPAAIGRYAPGIAQGAAEGALYAGADVTERAILGDPELTAESALAEVGMGSLFGGSFMGVGQAAGEGLSSLLHKSSNVARKAAERLASGENKEALRLVLSDEMRPAVIALDRTAPGAADSLASAVHADTAKFLLQNAARVQEVEAAHPGLLKAVLVKATPEEAAFVLDNASAIISGTLERNAIGQSLTNKITETYQNTAGAVRTAWREARSAEMEALAAKAEPAAAAKQAAGVFDDLAEATNTAKRTPELYTPGTGTRLERLGEGIVRDATANPAETYLRLNRLKQSLDDLIPWGTEAGTAAGRDTAALLKGLRGRVKDALEDASVWGEAAERQKAFNGAFQEYKDAAKRIGAGKGNGTLEARILRKIDDGAGGITYEANANTVDSWLNAMAKASGGAKSSAFRTYLDKAEALAAEMGKSGYEGADQLANSIRQMRDSFGVTEHQATVNYVINRLHNPGKIMVSQGFIPSPGEVAREAGKAALHEIPGVGTISRTATATLEKIRRSPSAMVGLLGAFAKLAEKTSQAIDGKIGRVLSGEAAAGAAAAAEAAVGRGTVTITPKDFPRVASDLRHHGSDPVRLAETVATHTAGLDEHAPTASLALAAAAARGVQHLQGHLPVGPARLPLNREYLPSRAELRNVNRAHEVMQAPLRALDHVAKGTLDPIHVQALEAVYPKLTQHMRTKVLEGIASRTAAGKTIPRHTRLALSLFLGSPLDSSVNPETIAANQATMAQAPKQQDQMPAPQGGGKAKAVKGFAALATPGQRSQGRDGRA